MEESGYIVDPGSELGVIELEDSRTVQRIAFFEGRVVGEVQEYESDRLRKWVRQSDLLCCVVEEFRPIARTFIERCPPV
jgi:hypothetical protein